MLLKSYYNVKNLEIPENGPELPLPPTLGLKISTRFCNIFY